MTVFLWPQKIVDIFDLSDEVRLPALGKYFLILKAQLQTCSPNAASFCRYWWVPRGEGSRSCWLREKD